MHFIFFLIKSVFINNFLFLLIKRSMKSPNILNFILLALLLVNSLGKEKVKNIIRENLNFKLDRNNKNFDQIFTKLDLKETNLNFIDKRNNLEFTKKSVITPICNVINCPNAYGKCVNNDTCKCNSGFVDISSILEKNEESFSKKFFGLKNIFCSYEQKYQIIALVLEFFFPFGLGHFYLNRIIIGLLKLIFALLIYTFFRLSVNNRNFSNRVFNNYAYFKNNFYLFYNILLISLYVVIHCYDLTMLILDKYTDGNGIELIKYF